MPRIALLQFSPATGDANANIATVEDWFSNLDGSVDLAVLPEVWTAGYGCKTIAADVAPHGPASLAALQRLARQHNSNIAGSMPWPDPATGRSFNRHHWIGRDGKVLGQYDKIHLFAMMHEEKQVAPGHEVVVADTDIARAGLAVCFDIRFPEFIRALALEGARLLVVPAQWPHPRLEHYRTLLRARAIENQMFVIGVNRTGLSHGLHFFGASTVIDPWGEILLEMPESQTGWGYADIDFAKVEEVRSKLPVFPLRKPGLYPLG